MAYTVLACDAGPVLAAEALPLAADARTPELLDLLFARGTTLEEGGGAVGQRALGMEGRLWER